MLEHSLLTILFALGAMLAWGSGDFSGGVASKRLNAGSVLLIAQSISFAPLLLLTLSFEFGLPRVEDVGLGALSGIFGMIGLINLYQGLAQGRMSIVAPLVAILSAFIPVIFGGFIDGLPTAIQMLGFGVAIAAIWLISTDGQKFVVTSIELRFALASGAGFAGYLVIVDALSGETTLWPLLIARVVSMSMLLAYLLLRRELQFPTWSLLPLIALTGLLDTTGSFLYILAAQAGRLDVAAVLSSLYPAITIILARFILHEQLRMQQWFGVLIAFFAIVMIAF